MLFNPKISIDFTAFKESLASLETTELEQLVNELNLMIQQRKKPSFAKQEATLIRKIKHGGPTAAFRRRYQALAEQSAQEKLSPTEHEELSAMIPISEQWTVERLQYLIELSKLWRISVAACMQKLELEAPNPIHA